MLWIVNILIFSTDITTKYNETNRIQVLKQNLTNIVKELDTSWLNENEIFYVHKNRASWNIKYEIYTGSTNENYKYIDELGNTISDLSLYQWDIYSQVLWVSTEDITFLEQNQVIRASIRRLVKK
jgi:hypothetical protein